MTGLVRCSEAERTLHPACGATAWHGSTAPAVTTDVGSRWSASARLRAVRAVSRQATRARAVAAPHSDGACGRADPAYARPMLVETARCSSGRDSSRCPRSRRCYWPCSPNSHARLRLRIGASRRHGSTASPSRRRPLLPASLPRSRACWPSWPVGTRLGSGLRTLAHRTHSRRRRWNLCGCRSMRRSFSEPVSGPVPSSGCKTMGPSMDESWMRDCSRVFQVWCPRWTFCVSRSSRHSSRLAALCPERRTCERSGCPRRSRDLASRPSRSSLVRRAGTATRCVRSECAESGSKHRQMGCPQRAVARSRRFDSSHLAIARSSLKQNVETMHGGLAVRPRMSSGRNTRWTRMPPHPRMSMNSSISAVGVSPA